MTRMVASVADVAEAEIALAGEVDVIEVADTAARALEAASPDAIRRIVAFAAGRKPVIASCGDVATQPEAVYAAVQEAAAAGADYAGIGFRPAPDAAARAEVLAPLGRRTKLIAVLFADLEPDLDLLPVLAGHGFHGIMMDTADKRKGRLLDHLPPERLPAFVERCRALGLAVGMGGSLEAPDVPRLLPLGPDFLSFRRALTERSDRTSPLSAEAVAKIRALIPEEKLRDGTAGIGRLRSVRAPGLQEPRLGADRIFVRDFVLPVPIGAYSFEHGQPQKVRFDVTAEVPRPAYRPEDLRHVVSYDLIMDGIRAVVARGHVQLSETLAEEIAAHVLANPRVLSVTVRVEKLELGAGGVGVEIVRRQGEQVVSAARSVPGQ